MIQISVYGALFYYLCNLEAPSGHFSVASRETSV